MSRIRLETGPRHELVAEFDVPSFAEDPYVVIWGSRVFAYNPASPNDDAFDEVFAYVVPPTLEPVRDAAAPAQGESPGEPA